MIHLATLASAVHGAGIHYIAPYYYAARPASVQANPTLLALSIFGLLAGSLLACEVVWRKAHELIEDPHPLRHPLTAERANDLLVSLALLLFIGPDALQFTSWPDVSPWTRHAIAIGNRCGDFAAIIPLVTAWLYRMQSSGVVAYQLRREPVNFELWLSWPKLRRPLWIGLLLTLASIALSFGR